ncbi:HD domain-containing protein [Candidatus Saccharibacteria bacterium]|nr:HD domain-containing protein [Candidatus Saccharibacteria bacterium]
MDGLWQFLTTTEKLKTELRHSWTSDSSRQESVTDHSWMLCLIAVTLLEEKPYEHLDKLRVLQMLIVHDLAEAITGDIPTFEQSKRKTKYQDELEAMHTILAPLPASTKDVLLDAWLEMEANETPEAKFAQCIDKAEVLFQHVIADIKTWDDGDYSLACWNKDEYFDHSPAMRAFKDYINERFWQKMEKAGTLNRLKPEHTARRDKSS